MLDASDRDTEELRLGWCEGLVRYRRVVYALLIGTLVVSFNGVWRIGLDSALYRGIGHSLAAGEGFKFAGDLDTHAYPGLPIVLASFERVFGQTVVPVLVLMVLLAGVTLRMIESLVKLRFPHWVAMLVVLGLGLNGWFVQQAHEVMTDMPFLFGVVAALLGWEWLRQDRGPRWRAMLMLGLGLVVAASMRPTFWVMAGAWGLICVMGLIHPARSGRRRRVYGIGLLLLIVTTGLFVVLDTMSQRYTFYDGVYLRDLRDSIRMRWEETSNLDWDVIFGGDLNHAFFMQAMLPVSAIVLLAGAAILTKRAAMWGLPVLLLYPVTLLGSSEPRYYLMVMPMLWLGWVLLGVKITLKTGPRWQGYVLAGIVLMPVVLNAGKIGSFIFEQRRADLAFWTDQTRAEAFYEKYREGSIPELIEVAKLIRETTSETETIVAPRRNILAYLSGRRVIGERQILAGVDVIDHPLALERNNARLYVLPAGLYDERDPLLSRLIRKRIVVAETVRGRVGEHYLGEVRIVVPEGDWRDYTPPPRRERK
jgi:hypothetical protein